MRSVARLAGTTGLASQSASHPSRAGSEQFICDRFFILAVARGKARAPLFPKQTGAAPGSSGSPRWHCSSETAPPTTRINLFRPSLQINNVCRDTNVLRVDQGDGLSSARSSSLSCNVRTSWQGAALMRLSCPSEWPAMAAQPSTPRHCIAMAALAAR